MPIAALFWRLVVLAFALFAEAIIVVVVGLYAAMRFPEDFDVFDRLPPADAAHGIVYLLAIAFIVLWAALHAMTPWLIAVALTEVFRWRGVLTHVVVGGFVAIAAAVTSGAVLLLPALQIILALGLVGGFVHWLLVGRDAGRWSEPVEPLPPPGMPGPNTWPRQPPPPSGPSGPAGPSGPSLP